MEWDLGVGGLALLVAMSLATGVVAQLVMGRRTTRWLWAVTSAAVFAGGLLTSEVWFGWATEEDLQPNVDGLSFDEVLFADLVVGAATVLVTWFILRRQHGGQRSGG